MLTNGTDGAPAACCFDFDGLLADTGALWAHAYTRACASLGAAPSRIDLDDLQGRSVAGAATALSAQLGIVVDETRLLGALTHAFRTRPPSLLPGARALLLHLAGRVPLLVVTNGPHHLVEDALATARLRHLFQFVISADSVENPKPAPDVYLAACRAAGVPPAEAVAFEDSPVGAMSAVSAGLRVVGVSTTVSLPADLVVDRLDDHRVRAYLGIP